MSDTSQGPGWWQASDGKWYPPEATPGGQPQAPQQPGGHGGGGGTYGVPVGGNVPTPDVGAAFSYGWNKFVANIGDLLVIWLIVIAVNVIFNLGGQVVDSLVLSTMISFVGWIVSLVVQIALIRVGLLITAGKAPTPEAAFDTKVLVPFIIGSLLYGLAVFIGFFVLCVGALVAAFLFWFYGYFIVDQEQDPVDSLKSSMQMTTKNFGTFGLFAIAAVLLSCVTCGLAAPIVQIAAAYMYRTANGQPVAP